MTLVSILSVTLMLDIALTCPTTHCIPPYRWEDLDRPDLVQEVGTEVKPEDEEKYTKYSRGDYQPEFFDDENEWQNTLDRIKNAERIDLITIITD